MVFTTQGQSTVYSDSIALFVNGYLAVVAEESMSIKEYMGKHVGIQPKRINCVEQKLTRP